jgi:hypothetical protein
LARGYQNAEGLFGNPSRQLAILLKECPGARKLHRGESASPSSPESQLQFILQHMKKKGPKKLSIPLRGILKLDKGKTIRIEIDEEKLHMSTCQGNLTSKQSPMGGVEPQSAKKKKKR